jgi:NAD(P)H-dependent flavin oxidoreductase YrpB (nitropropane dioxygenase family)
MNNRICNLFGIQYPIIQAGMIWCSGWELASAVSNAGGLGIIGAVAVCIPIFCASNCASAKQLPINHLV